MEAVGSGRLRGTARAARLAWHPAPHSGVVRKLAQPGAGCPAVRDRPTAIPTSGSWSGAGWHWRDGPHDIRDRTTVRVQS